VKNQTKAYLFALTAVACWSTVATAFKITLRHLDVWQMLLIASVTSVGVLGGILMVTGQFVALREFRAVDLRHSALRGFLNPFLYYAVLLTAYGMLPAQEAQSLNYTWSIVLVVMAILFLKQRLHLGSLTAVVVSYGGVLVIATHGRPWSLHFDNATGTALAVGSAFIWGAYWILNMRDHRNEVARLFVNFAFGSLYSLVAALLWSDPWVFRPAGLAGAFYIGWFEMGIPFAFWLRALKLSENTARVSNLVYLSPFLSLVFINFFLGETVQAYTVVGLALIVAGIFLQQWLARRYPDPQPV
jgi:drug/metabolite transporter (DMT)-like permease